jgi:glycosyltransferase involved in cell wall biosynthesis
VRISFCIITLNEEANLARCLESCAGLADEILVLDSGSTDRTRAIAESFGARWEHQDWLGYVGQKNRALALVSHEWVFSLDADEALSAQLRQEIQGIRATPPPDVVSGFDLLRRVCYEGRWIRHGDWNPDRLVRLFRRSRARFAGGKVHERLEVAGAIRHLSGELHHYSFRDAADHRARGEKYARLWAETQAEAGRRAGALSPYAHAALRWLRGYVFKRGFLDGPQGWRIAALSAREVLLKYRLLRRLQRRDSSGFHPGRRQAKKLRRRG